MSKYKAVKTVVNGISFMSKAEAKRYQDLIFKEKLHLILNLELQPKFTLQETFKKNGITYRAINYIADFRYFDIIKGITVVEDVKGFKTKEYLLKKKLFEFKYPELHLVEVS